MSSGQDTRTKASLASEPRATAAPTGGRRAAPPRSRDDADAPVARDRDMGEALRSVYQDAVAEAVPDEMIALLGKLD